MGAPNAGGVGKIGDFPQITGYISKMVQDRRMVSITVNQAVSYTHLTLPTKRIV